MRTFVFLLSAALAFAAATAESVLAEGDVCRSGGVETGELFDRHTDCPKGTVCRTQYAGMMGIGGEVKMYCLPVLLSEGDVCKSGGVETGELFDRHTDCPTGTVCRAMEGVAGIGGEVKKYCLLPLVEEFEHCATPDGDIVQHGEITMIACNSCRCFDGILGCTRRKCE